MGGGQTYLIADEEYVPIKSLVLRVADAMGKEVKIIIPFYPFLIAAHIYEKLCRPLGITSHVSAPHGLLSAGPCVGRKDICVTGTTSQIRMRLITSLSQQDIRTWLPSSPVKCHRAKLALCMWL